MKKIILAMCIISSVASLTACTAVQTDRALVGAATGAATGLGAAALTGGGRRTMINGALTGAAVGAAAGALTAPAETAQYPQQQAQYPQYPAYSQQQQQQYPQNKPINNTPIVPAIMQSIPGATNGTRPYYGY
jgi:hypothetical protein